MHGDDYMLNSKLHYAIVTCAITYDRAASLVTLLGMSAPSTTDHYGMKVRDLALSLPIPQPQPSKP
jgi:hypothetical protein